MISTKENTNDSWEARCACITGQCGGWWFSAMDELCWDCLFRFNKELGLDAAGKAFGEAAQALGYRASKTDDRKAINEALTK